MGGCLSKNGGSKRAQSYALHLLQKDEAKQLRKIWTYHIQPDAGKFFDQTLHAALKRSSVIRQTVGIVGANFESDETTCAYIYELAFKLMEFLKIVCFEMNDLHYDVAKKYAQELGARHVHYGGGKFQTIYWDIFVLSMTERLEKQPAVTPVEIYIWQKFVRQIVEWMREGHEQEAVGSELLNC